MEIQEVLEQSFTVLSRTFDNQFFRVSFPRTGSAVNGRTVKVLIKGRARLQNHSTGDYDLEEKKSMVELHVHLDGSMRLATLFDIARDNNVDVGCSTLDEFREKICVYEAHSLMKVLASFKLFMPLIAGNRTAIERVAYEFCEDCAKNRIRYVEARYSPQLLANNEDKPQYAPKKGDLTPKEVVKIVCEQFKKGSKDFGIRCRSILCTMRHRQDWSEEIVNLALQFREEGVVGIDIAGASEDPELEVEHIFPGHIAAFKRAKSLGIHITAHAGEANSADKVKTSLEELCAERIGHGYRSVEDEKVYNEIKERQVHLELCPLSSICTGAVSPNIEDHPVVRFAKDGVNFSINSDDPLVFDSCLLDDYVAAKKAGLTKELIIQSIFNAAKSCFAPEEEKQMILQELKSVYNNRP